MKYIYLAIIILLIYLLYSRSNFEFFNEFNNSIINNRNDYVAQIDAFPHLTIANHVRLNKFNQVDAITTRPPVPREGELICKKVSCPSVLPSDAICWRCS